MCTQPCPSETIFFPMCDEGLRRTVANGMDIYANDHQSSDMAMKVIELGKTSAQMLSFHFETPTLSYPTPTSSPMMLFFVASANTNGI